jgi:hypothetical protein
VTGYGNGGQDPSRNNCGTPSFRAVKHRAAPGKVFLVTGKPLNVTSLRPVYLQHSASLIQVLPCYTGNIQMSDNACTGAADSKSFATPHGITRESAC